MSNLLEKASILLTPTAYDDGKILSVKPSVVLGEELITNGDFTNGSTGWTLGTGWSIGDNVANAVDAAFNSQLVYSDNVVANTKYKVSFNVSNYVKGNVRVNIGNVASDTVSSNGNFTFVLTSLNVSPLIIQSWAGGSGTSLSVTNISVKQAIDGDFDFTRNSSATRVNSQGLIEDVQILSSNLVTNGDFSNGSTGWILGTGITIGENKAIFTSTASGQSVSQNAVASSLTNGALAKVSFEVLSRTQGSFGVYFSGTLVGTLASAGVFTGYFTKGTETSFYIRALGTTSGSISNISVIEITSDTNLPRIDYTGGEGHWLFEPQSTNLISYSEDFTQWNKVNYTVQSNAAVSPSGGFDASFVTNPSGGGGNIKQNLNVTASTTYIFSFYAKRGTASDAKYSVYDNTNGGDIIPSTSYYSQINSDTFTRITVLFTTPVGCTSLAVYILRDSASAGNTIVWGAQVEAQTFATSYIPTSGSTVTRLQDAAFGAGSSDLINSTEGVLYFEGSALADDGTNRYLSLDDGTTSNYIYFRYVSTSNNVLFRTVIANVTINTLTVVLSDTIQNHKFAYKWKSGDYALWVDGVEISTDLSATTFPSNTLNNLGFNFPTSTGGFYANTKCVAVFKEALSDTELQKLTQV